MDKDVLNNSFENLMQNPGLSPAIFLQLGDEFINLMRSNTGINTITYSEEYILALDQIIDSIRENITGNEELFLVNVLRFGSFLGEASIRLFGGAWIYDQEKNRWGIQAEMKNSDKMFLNVFYKVKNRIINGEEDSISFYYQGVKKMLAGDDYLKES